MSIKRYPFYLRLTQEEVDLLCELALQECRQPREQARFLLRIGLGLHHNDDQLADLQRRVEELEVNLAAMNGQRRA